MTEKNSNAPKKSGMAARAGALRLIHAVLSDNALLDDAYRDEISNGPLRKLTGSDRAFSKRIAITVLQHLGEIDTLLARFMDRGMPKKSGPLRNILRIGVAELIYLETPPHAVVDCAVSHYRTWRKYAGFKGLTNAILRRVANEGKEELTSIDPARANLPDWLYRAWCNSYGLDVTNAMMAEFLKPQIPLDLTLNPTADKAHWAAELGAVETPTGSLRLIEHERVDRLPGFEEGVWWVQDAAATVPVTLLGDVKDKEVLDLCAAPGGKSLQMAANGAHVTAVDISAKRLERVSENLERTGLTAELVTGDVFKHDFGRQWPLVLLDAPCSATGTVRRHPELIHQRFAEDIAHFSKLQTRMLDRVAGLVEPGGMMVFCTCSLQPEEGPDLIADFLMSNPEFGIEPVKPGEFEGLDPFIQLDGSIRTRPDIWAESGGLDGFFAIRLKRMG
ncbi:16S rRNA (cytosine967-C5)-methyltransferase [Cohaesibacter sp. ES.047]|uniref:RsmB/NOP family class I SAM-dependent RNA methyltransferase n=1 Tax=Cohaesibacter sp. ES.047 TaxID=1798205 RepID=UPI000BB6D561|nr:transcription antitermination factor NusB [Cohaesibacter sp. ES.047]SNY90633.1 16S rRNA (cytosine967-C5)-methyltransferase [Cohaesibacter sp. ES.047]